MIDPMRILYTVCFYLGLPIIFARLWWRSRRAPAYRQRWRERLGVFPPPQITGPLVWVHAVSVGETLAALPLVKALEKAYPNTHLLVTTMTPTGSEQVRSALGERVFHVYMPYDLPDSLARFFNRVKPQLLVIMETELWPNTIAACHRRGIAVVVANARLSEKSAQGYQRFGAITKPMLQQINIVAAQHQDDAKRFLALGLQPQHCAITGNIKFDLTIPPPLKEKAEVLKQTWSNHRQRLVWLAASTHEGEEEKVLSAFSAVKKMFPEMLLVIVPRHPERFDRVAKLSNTWGFGVQKRSEGEAINHHTEVLVGDTMGELLLFFGASDMAFIGGSLVCTGGHNLIEPAAWGLPIVSGPHLFNFSEVSRLLLDAKALIIANDDDQLAAAVKSLSESVADRRHMGQAARAVAEANRGALQQLVQIISRYL